MTAKHIAWRATAPARRIPNRTRWWLYVAFSVAEAGLAYTQAKGYWGGPEEFALLHALGSIFGVVAASNVPVDEPV